MKRIPRRLRLALYGLACHAALFALLCAAYRLIQLP